MQNDLDAVQKKISYDRTKHLYAQTILNENHNKKKYQSFIPVRSNKFNNLYIYIVRFDKINFFYQTSPIECISTNQFSNWKRSEHIVFEIFTSKLSGPFQRIPKIYQIWNIVVVWEWDYWKMCNEHKYICIYAAFPTRSTFIYVSSFSHTLTVYKCTYTIHIAQHNNNNNKN